MSSGLILVGCGGHGRVVLDAALAAGMKVSGIVDPALVSGSAVRSVEVVGGDEVIARASDGWLNGVGANPSIAARRALFDRNTALGLAAPVVIHPRATIARDVDIAPAAQVMAGAVIQTGTVVGRNAVINTSASIDHDCIVGDHAFISPGATICGGVAIGEGAFVGAGCVILPGCRIGAGSVVGAGAIVRKEVPDGCVFAGNPARMLKRNA